MTEALTTRLSKEDPPQLSVFGLLKLLLVTTAMHVRDAVMLTTVTYSLSASSLSCVAVCHVDQALCVLILPEATCAFCGSCRAQCEQRYYLLAYHDKQFAWHVAFSFFRRLFLKVTACVATSPYFHIQMPPAHKILHEAPAVYGLAKELTATLSEPRNIGCSGAKPMLGSSFC